ncbi:MAG: protein kinase [Myxococcales bacterium]
MTTGTVEVTTPRGTLCGGRFQLDRELGAGGMGVVYAAWDHDNNHWVAIKMLTRLDAEGMYRIKREFRGFAGIRHRGLLELYELIDDDGRLFITMELVDGEPLLDVLHPALSGLLEELPQGDDPRGLPPTPVRDMARLRRLFLQVAEALQFLHDAGRLHRDLKPDNVLVDGDDRAVLLDFGISATLGVDGKLDTRDERLIGTPAYMAPETLDRGGDERSDWYAFGAMLYEVLVGDVPISDRSLADLYRLKRTVDPPVPEACVHGVPDDLSRLAMELLNRDPAARPSGEQVLQRLAAVADAGSRDAPRAAHAPPFVGREAELAVLRHALDDCTDERPRVALVHGASGIGKSALVARFVREQLDPSAWVLTTRCYEHESVRFKAFDGLVDALSRKLAGLTDAATAALLPRKLAALVAVFPVLGRVPLMGRKRQPERFELPAEPAELRRAAFGALRELLARIALRRPLVLFIDDLQWGDEDSVLLLRDLVTGEGTPGLLLLCTYRSEDAERSPCLLALSRLREKVPEVFVEVPLSPMSGEEAAALARSLSTELDPATLEHLAREAGGSPFLLGELVGHHAASAGDTLPDVRTVLLDRVARLSRDARELLELLAVAGRPLPRKVYAVAREADVDLQAAVAELLRAKLVRGSGTRSALCPYHDRIREAVVDSLDPRRRADLHARIVRVLEAQPDTDVETLLNHLVQAGNPSRAAGYAQVAASRAASRLAFERSAALFRFALEHDPGDVERQLGLRHELAHVLSLSGRRAEAAQVYLDGAQSASAAEAADLRQRAGQELLLSGHFVRGRALLRDALNDLGASLPEDVGEALQAWAQANAELAARGLDYTPRRPEQVAPEVALRLDTLWAAGFGLSRVEGVRVYGLLGKLVREALDHADTVRVVRALCAYHVLADYPAHVLGGEPLGLRRRAAELAETVDEPQCEAWALLARGLELWFAGDPTTLECLHGAAEILHDRCVGVTPELGFARQLIVGVYLACASWDHAVRDCHRFAQEAEAVGDQLYNVVYGLEHVFAGLLRGDLQAGRTEAARLLEDNKLRREETLFPLRFSVGDLAAAAGDVTTMEAQMQWAHDFLQRPEGQLPNFRAMTRVHQARMAAGIAAHTWGDRREPLLSQVDKWCASALHRGIELMAAPALTLQAGVAVARGRRELAITLLEAAIDRAAGFAGMLRDLASFHRGRLLGGERGEAERAAALRALSARGVQDVALLTAAAAPLLDEEG